MTDFDNEAAEAWAWQDAGHEGSPPNPLADDPYVNVYFGTGLSREPGGPDLGNSYHVDLRCPEGIFDRHAWRWLWYVPEPVVFTTFTPFPRLGRLERRVARGRSRVVSVGRIVRGRLSGCWGVLRGDLVAADPEDWREW